jgi:hypothetical protein
MSRGGENPGWPFFRFALFVTGHGEREFLAGLFRDLERDGHCHFQVVHNFRCWIIWCCDSWAARSSMRQTRVFGRSSRPCVLRALDAKCGKGSCKRIARSHGLISSPKYASRREWGHRPPEALSHVPVADWIVAIGRNRRISSSVKARNPNFSYNALASAFSASTSKPARTCSWVKRSIRHSPTLLGLPCHQPSQRSVRFWWMVERPQESLTLVIRKSDGRFFRKRNFTFWNHSRFANSQPGFAQLLNNHGGIGECLRQAHTAFLVRRPDFQAHFPPPSVVFLLLKIDEAGAPGASGNFPMWR